MCLALLHLLTLDFSLKKMGKQKCYLLICILLVLTSELESDLYCEKSLWLLFRFWTRKQHKRMDRYPLGGFCGSEGERSKCLGAGNDPKDREVNGVERSLGNRIGKT